MSDSMILYVTMWAGIATAVGTLALAFLACLALGPARGTLKQMKADSAAQTRPYLTAELVPSLGGPPSWDLLIRNAGASAATGVIGKFSPEPSNPKDETVVAVSKILSEGRTIAPGSVLRLYWRYGEAPDQTKTSGSDGFVDDGTLTLSYQGVEEKTYSESFPLRPAVMVPLPEEGPTRLGSDPERFAEKQRATLIRAVNSLRAPW